MKPQAADPLGTVRELRPNMPKLPVGIRSAQGPDAFNVFTFSVSSDSWTVDGFSCSIRFRAQDTKLVTLRETFAARKLSENAHPSPATADAGAE